MAPLENNQILLNNNPGQNAINHYENVDAVVVQQPIGVPAPINEPNVAQIINLQHHRVPAANQQYHPSYRNDVYDVPRNVRNNNFYANIPNANPRRSNLHLDFNRPRCPQNNPQKHQRSFDDTESCYGYGSNQGYNMYERVGAREEPLYQNAGMYGRLDVIGHGIGRIERHLSSSCGNIDHYNVGGHYAVLSHSHVNQMVMNSSTGTSTNSAQNPRDGVKSFFSCLGGESTQSLSNINGGENNGQPQAQNLSAPSSVQRATGAIPKTKNKQSNKVSPKPNPVPSQAGSAPPIPPPMPTNNRISKSSLQYLLLNKWLPLGPDYKIIDFNFMFSRNCSSTGPCESGEGVVQFNGQAEMVEPGIFQPQREYPTMNPTNYPRVIRNTPHLSRLRESEAESGQYENVQRADGFRGVNAFRARSESPNFNGPRPRNHQEDPFRNWAFNFENNSFRPAGAVPQRDVKRITDGTIAAKDFQEQNPRKELPAIIVEQQEAEIQDDPQPSTSKSTSPSTVSENSGASTSKTSEMKKSENYDNLASLQQDVGGPSTSPAQNNTTTMQRKKKSTESQSSDSVTLAEEDEDADDAFDELESDID